MNKQTVVVVEDDSEIAEIVIMYLQAANFLTQWFADGKEVVQWVQENEPALILLDLDLPTKSGVDVCKEVRGFSDIPIIMTTAKVEEVDRLVGLELGADDYVCKPYSVKELIARVKANLRRVTKQPFIPEGLQVNSEDFTVSYKHEKIQLTALEFTLLNLLYSNANRIYSRALIMDLVYQDYRDVNDRTVDSHIRNLRKKLKELPLEHDLIRSIYGAGYKFEPIV
ncbi:response regulator [Thalassotalea psychrophila]|uniref:Response regulator n=1 Tax=Thalassotalea psychrophila TaxID=3065647 RepID=A0ABY9TQ03_9GAMM|nr:response regulator [Colwelliaceae bacterium SQ149]